MNMQPITFPLYVVIDPTPQSVMADVCVTVESFADLESWIIGTNARYRDVQSRNPVLFWSKAGAECDAAERLRKRDEKPRALSEVLALLDRIDVNGKSLPSDLREEIVTTLDAARAAGWRPPAT